MKLFRLFGAGLGAAVLALSASAFSADLALSGTVYGTDNKPLPGVMVKLAQAGLSTITGADGTWSLGQAQTTGLEKRQVVPVGSGRLQVEDGRISIDFSGHDLLGRGLGAPAKAMAQRDRAARSAASLDTLQYTWLGKVRLLDTVSAWQSGIVRILDTTFNASVLYGYLVDSRDGQIYRTVRIETQTWMAQNLNYKGSGPDSGWAYNNVPDSAAKYGRLYTWASVMGLSDSCNKRICSTQVAPRRQGMCPPGWHVPSDGDWHTLVAVSMDSITSGKNLKSKAGWVNLGNGTDIYGFRALPAGNPDLSSFRNVGYSSDLWTATESDATCAWHRFVGYANRAIDSYDFVKLNGFSLRCLQD